MKPQRSSPSGLDSAALSFADPFMLPISRSERWQVHQRLIELDIRSCCLQGGGLAVEVANPVALIQLRSLLLQLTAPRQQLLGWLEHCWQLS
ncbi:MAG: Asr1405/Asl0597 family protein [Elainella sp.]